MTNKFIAAAFVGLLVATGPLGACPFCSGSPPTLLDEVSNYPIIARASGKNVTGAGGDYLEITITKLLKGDPKLIAEKQVHRLPGLHGLPDEQVKDIVVFGDLKKGKLEFHRGWPVDQVQVDYLSGLLRVKVDPKNRQSVLRYCFDFLDHQIKTISDDALAEFERASDADSKNAAADLSVEKMRQWVKADTTKPPLLALACFLLGQRGDRNEAPLIAAAMPKFAKDISHHKVRVLVGYSLVDAKAGWSHVVEISRNEKNDFLHRFCALKVAKYFSKSRPGVIAEKDMVEVLAAFLTQNDIADLAIDELRQQKHWSLTSQVLPLSENPGKHSAIIRLSVICYAMKCPDPACVKLVGETEKKEPHLVQQANSILDAEAAATGHKKH